MLLGRLHSLVGKCLRSADQCQRESQIAFQILCGIVARSVKSGQKKHRTLFIRIGSCNQRIRKVFSGCDDYTFRILRVFRCVGRCFIAVLSKNPVYFRSTGQLFQFIQYLLCKGFFTAQGGYFRIVALGCFQKVCYRRRYFIFSYQQKRLLRKRRGNQRIRIIFPRGNKKFALVRVFGRKLLCGFVAVQSFNPLYGIVFQRRLYSGIQRFRSADQINRLGCQRIDPFFHRIAQRIFRCKKQLRIHRIGQNPGRQGVRIVFPCSKNNNFFIRKFQRCLHRRLIAVLSKYPLGKSGFLRCLHRHGKSRQHKHQSQQTGQTSSFYHIFSLLLIMIPVYRSIQKAMLNEC